MNKEKFIEEAHEKFYARLFGFGIKFSEDTYLIEDCIQETFKKLHQEDLSKFEKDSSYLERWMFFVLKNFIFKRKRRLKKELLTEPSSGLFELIMSQDADPSETLEMNEDQFEIKKDYKKLYAAIESLSENQKKLIKLKYFKGLKHREIAVKLNTKLGNVGFNAQYALKKLQQKFKSKSLTSH